jgi:sugar phosphate isomerase/epimerase
VFKLGLDTYSVHHALSASDPDLKKDLLWLVDHLLELRLEGLQVDPSHFPDDPETLDKLKSAIEVKGHYVEFGMGGWTVDRMKERIALTRQFGGKALRTFLGSENTSVEQLQQWMDLAVPAFKEVAPVAEEAGVYVAIENHGDFISEQMQAFIERIGHPYVGVCLDTGNSLFRKEDPLDCAKRLAPYTRSMHLKDWTMDFNEAGEPEWTGAVLGEGEVPVAEILKIVVGQAQNDLYIALENPIKATGSMKETVDHEWSHVRNSAEVALEMLHAATT